MVHGATVTQGLDRQSPAQDRSPSRRTAVARSTRCVYMASLQSVVGNLQRGAIVSDDIEPTTEYPPASGRPRPSSNPPDPCPGPWPTISPCAHRGRGGRRGRTASATTLISSWPASARSTSRPPFRPRRRREISGTDGHGFANRADHVAGFTTPSAGVMPFFVWNWITAALVPAPKLPSGAPTL